MTNEYSTSVEAMLVLPGRNSSLIKSIIYCLFSPKKEPFCAPLEIFRKSSHFYPFPEILCTLLIGETSVEIPIKSAKVFSSLLLREKSRTHPLRRLMCIREGRLAFDSVKPLWAYRDVCRFRGCIVLRIRQWFVLCLFWVEEYVGLPDPTEIQFPRYHIRE